MKHLLVVTAIALSAASSAQEAGVIARKELSVVYPKEVYRDGRLSIKGFGGLTLDKGLVQGGAILAYSVRKYEAGAAVRFVMGRAVDFGIYIGTKF